MRSQDRCPLPSEAVRVGSVAGGEHHRHSEEASAREQFSRCLSLPYSQIGVQQRHHRLQRDLPHSLRSAELLLPPHGGHAARSGGLRAGGGSDGADEVREDAVQTAHAERAERRDGRREGGSREDDDKEGEEGRGVEM